jgi:predicted secreted protein
VGDTRSASALLNQLIDRLNQDKAAQLRLRGWQKTIQWQIDGEDFYWRFGDGRVIECAPEQADFVLKCTVETLQKVANRDLPFFMGLWGTGKIQFEGTFSDAYRLGYLFLSDKRKRRIMFVAHCWLNMNTRFPEGSGFAGANVPLIEVLLQNELGIVQMPCPECICLGLEKEGWATMPEKEMRACFRKVAQSVVDQIEMYLSYGYDIVGIMGMNPSPSCGVETTKGKGTMLGVNRDTSETEGSGVFIEELRNLAEERGLGPLPLFGVRRTLPGEGGLDEKLEELKKRLSDTTATLSI